MMNERHHHVMRSLLFILGVLFGILGVIGFGIQLGMPFPIGRHEGPLRVLLQEHSLIFFAFATPAIVFGLFLFRLKTSGWKVWISLGLGVISLLAALMPVFQSALAMRRFDTHMSGLNQVFESQTEFDPDNNLPSQKFNLRTWFNVPTTPVTPIVPVEYIYRTIDGHTLTLDVYSPHSKSASAPILILLHGGGLEAGSKSDVVGWANHFTLQGYVSIGVQYRLAPHAIMPAPLEDVQCAISWTREHANELGGDQDRIAIMGYSSGGQLAILAGFAGFEKFPPQDCPARSSKVEAVVAIAPVTDSAFYRSEILGVTPQSDPQAYTQSSPIEYALRGDPSPPILLVHGKSDLVVDYTDSLRFYNVLVQYSTIYLLDPDWSGHVFHAMPGGLASQITQYYIDRFLVWMLMH